MLNFYINRGGKNLPARRKKLLNDAKGELRRLYRKTPTSGNRNGKTPRSKLVRNSGQAQRSEVIQPRRPARGRQNLDNVFVDNEVSIL